MSKGIYKLREVSTLKSCEGSVEKISGELPKVLSKPLVFGDGKINAKLTDNGALVNCDKKVNDEEVYRLLGCSNYRRDFTLYDLLPSVVPYDEDFLDAVDRSLDVEPCSLGSFSMEEANNEIRTQREVMDILKEYNILSPLEPIARYDYCSDTNKGHCVVSLSRGDLRLDEFLYSFANPSKTLRDYKEQIQRFHQWLGFAHRMIDDINIDKTENSNNLSNFVLYDVGKGYGISRVGFELRSKSKFFNVLRGINMGEFDYSIKNFILENNLEKFLMNNNRVFVSRGFENQFAVNEDGELLLFLNDEALPDKERDIESFDAGFSGDLPEPISKKFIHRILENSVF